MVHGHTHERGGSRTDGSLQTHTNAILTLQQRLRLSGKKLYPGRQHQRYQPDRRGIEYFSLPYSAPPEGEEVDIFVCGTYLHIQSIPCRVVYEQPVKEESAEIPQDGSMIRKRCGIEFRLANDQQREQLETFIRQYIQDRVSDQN